MKLQLLFLFAILLLLPSCYQEEDIEAVKGTPRYIIEDSSDPLDHEIYEIFRRTGVYVLYDYTLYDYLWDLGSLNNSTNRLTLQTDRTVLLEGVKYLKKVLMDFYSDDFMQKFFPLKIFLAANIDNASTSAVEDLESGAGREYLALGKIRAGEIPSTAEGLLKAKGELNAYLWSNVMIKNGLLTLPEAFEEVSSALYTKNFGYAKGYTTDNPLWYPTDAELMAEGFWDVDPYNSLNNPYPRILDPITGRPVTATGAPATYNMMPNYVNDLNMWIAKITTMSREEILAIIGNYEKMMFKYNILINSVQEQLGFDLQAVGADKPQP